jgi:hypothetical protein
MAARPQNIGIKAIEIYFPSQVCTYGCHACLTLPLRASAMLETLSCHVSAAKGRIWAVAVSLLLAVAPPFLCLWPASPLPTS